MSRHAAVLSPAPPPPPPLAESPTESAQSPHDPLIPAAHAPDLKLRDPRLGGEAPFVLGVAPADRLGEQAPQVAVIGVQLGDVVGERRNLARVVRLQCGQLLGGQEALSLGATM